MALAGGIGLHFLIESLAVGRVAVGFSFEALRQYLHLVFTGGDLSLILAVQRHRLAQDEQMLPPVVAHQAFGDCLLSGSNTGISQRGQRMYISIPVENRVDGGQSCHSGDIADDMAKLQVHLVQRFLHVLDMGGRHIDDAGPMSQQ
jgi:hypothetical protein